MNLIENLKKIKKLEDFFCTECSENNISINIDVDVSTEDLLIIKVDDYYNKNIPKPNPSPDCLIIQKCKSGKYNIYIVELKNIDGPGGFSLNNVVSKFITCLDDFMNNILGEYFNSDDVFLNQIKLLFITDPYHFKTNPDKQLKMKGHKLDVLISQRIPKFFNHHLYIEHKLPDPIIKACA